MMKKFQKILNSFLTTIHIILLGAMVLLGIIAIFRPDLVQQGIDWAGVQVKSWGNWNYAIIFLTAMGESFPFVGAVLPGMNIMILVGGFFVSGAWQIFPFAFLLAVFGACLGNAFGYFMGRWSHPETFNKYALYFGAGPRELAWLQGQIRKNGFWFIVIAKFHNLLRSFIPYIAGLEGFSGPKFWIANIIGSSIWAFSILLLGVFAVENYEIVLTYLNYFFIGIIIVAVIIYSVKKQRK